MINNLKIIQTPKHQFNYLTDKSDNKNIIQLYDKLERGIEFKPGLNYIIGENGSGKSTILNIIRSMNRCSQSFTPREDHFVSTTIKDLAELFTSFELKGDYRDIIFNLYRFVDDRSRLCSDYIETSEEFIALANIKSESNGQNVMGDIATLFNWMFKRFSECKSVLKLVEDIYSSSPNIDSILSLITKDKENITSREVFDAIMKNQIDSATKYYTILMDEPDQGLDIKNLKDVYEILSYDKPNSQLIAVIHNPLLIYNLSRSTNANWIETTDGYLNFVKNEVDNFLHI